MTFSRVDAASVIEWIYSLQIPADSNDPESNKTRRGFRGGHFLGVQNTTPFTAHPYDGGHLAGTYTALSLLTMLGKVRLNSLNFIVMRALHV